jgi:GAF domain-containing protein
VKGVREGLGTAADVIGIWGFVAAVFGISAVAFLGKSVSVPVWAGLLGLAVLAVLARIFLRGRTPSSNELSRLEKELALASEEISVSANYMAQIKDIMWALHETFATGSIEDAHERLKRVQTLAFDAVIQGINTARGEQIRCAFFKPAEEDGETWLRTEDYHGHSDKVRKLRLHADARSVAGLAFVEESPVYIEDASSDPRLQKTEEGKPIGSLLCVPAFEPARETGGDKTTVIGVFSVASNRPRAFKGSDRDFAQACATIFGFVEFARRIIDIEPEPEVPSPVQVTTTAAAELPGQEPTQG